MMLLKSALVTVVAAYGLIVGAMWLFQGNLLHLPSSELVRTPADEGLDYEDVELTTEDGETLHGWWLPHPDPAGTVLFFHGNAGNISHRLDSLRIFHQLEQQVLIIDYRGYGESSGRPSEDGLYEDGRTAWRWLIEEQGVAGDSVTLFGRSLGAAVATKIATELGENEQPASLIVESAFTSVPDMGARLYPFLPVRTLSRYDYDTEAMVAEVRVPILIVHSPQDDIVPFRHGEAIQQAAEAGSAPRVDFLEISGDHNTGFLTSGDVYRGGLAEFLRSL
ncbi:alpha/beta hydrolase [Natronospirillum operosum]|uniref:Alpha/beta hydrolase n=1 Tax=Natronospirillum operosum TaxID=2759953 RepID=A0A4Z0WAX8_9GAMM|nr:alpha/beta hydrolase [Natronospirillum operosum]TGG91121.1 alpha/beta hydrolase [Natronospirillum operosum]